MRPDSRSFSFTWMKGSSQKSQQQPHQKLEDIDSKKSVEGGEMSTGENNISKEATEDSWGVGRGNSGSRLRRLSHSLVRLRGTNRYANMKEVEDENNWQKISEEPLSLEDEGEEEEEKEQQMEIQMEEPDVVAQAKVVALPFQPLENTGNAAAASTSAEENGGMSLSKRLNKTVQGMKTSIGNLSQRFRKSTRRRYRMPPSTPGSIDSPATRKILGRTPTKLYSPFGFESPISIKTPKRLADRPSTPRLARKNMVSSLVYSPSNNFRRDLDEARRGMQDFQILSRDITRRSVRF